MLARNLLAGAAAAVCLVSLAVGTAGGEDLRIETRIYVEGEEQPVAENLTLFHLGVVYDFLDTAPRETAVYNSQQGYFTLLDPQRKVKTRIEEKTLLEFIAGVRVAALKGDELVKEAAQPRFEVDYDERLSQVRLQGQALGYTAQGRPFPTENAARQYRQYADNYTRLNATRPGALPPFARLQLNRELAAKRLYPTQVELSTRTGRGLRSSEQTIRSEHAVTWRLSRDDLNRISTAGRQMAQFEAVGFPQYRQVKQLAERDPSRR